MRDDFILLLKTLKQLPHHPLRIQICALAGHVVRVVEVLWVLEIRGAHDHEFAVVGV
jgi:hypothetical protein